MDAFENRFKINASYWGLLNFLAGLVNDRAESAGLGCEWNAFYRRVFAPMRCIIQGGYGWPCTPESSNPALVPLVIGKPNGRHRVSIASGIDNAGSQRDKREETDDHTD
jgi:hypothetical protein